MANARTGDMAEGTNREAGDACRAMSGENNRFPELARLADSDKPGNEAAEKILSAIEGLTNN